MEEHRFAVPLPAVSEISHIYPRLLLDLQDKASAVGSGRLQFGTDKIEFIALSKGTIDCSELDAAARDLGTTLSPEIKSLVKLSFVDVEPGSVIGMAIDDGFPRDADSLLKYLDRIGDELGVQDCEIVRQALERRELVSFVAQVFRSAGGVTRSLEHVSDTHRLLFMRLLQIGFHHLSTTSQGMSGLMAMEHARSGTLKQKEFLTLLLSAVRGTKYNQELIDAIFDHHPDGILDRNGFDIVLEELLQSACFGTEDGDSGAGGVGGGANGTDSNQRSVSQDQVLLQLLRRTGFPLDSLSQKRSILYFVIRMRDFDEFGGFYHGSLEKELFAMPKKQLCAAVAGADMCSWLASSGSKLFPWCAISAPEPFGPTALHLFPHCAEKLLSFAYQNQNEYPPPEWNLKDNAGKTLLDYFAQVMRMSSRYKFISDACGRFLAANRPKDSSQSDVMSDE